MNYQILSPSWKRESICTSHKYLKGLRYVVCEAQADKYAEKKLPVLICPDKAQGNVSRVRNWILNHANGGNVCIVDDDIKHLGCWDGNKHKKMTAEEADEFIENGFNLAEQFDVRLWGINLLQDKGAFREYTPFSLTNVILGPFGGFRNCDARYDEALPLKEDYDLSLQLLNKHRKILRINHAHYVCEQHTNRGGCAEYRTIAAERNQFSALAKKWGGKIVRSDSGNSKTERTKQKTYDINPIIKVPIGGV